MPIIDTSNISDMSGMFRDCKSLEHVFYHSHIDYAETDSEQLKINYPEYFL